MLSMILAYKIFLARENQPGYNRCVLLMIYLVSFTTIPLISQIENWITPTAQPTALAGDIEVVNAAITPMSKPVWGTVLVWAFLIGMAVVTVRTFTTWLRLMKVIRNGEKIDKGRYVLVLTDNERFAPFSWMKYIVVSRADIEANHQAIIQHEMKHISCHHWVDLLIAQIVCITNWFNPAAWLMRDELTLVHEYQADMAVIDNGNSPREYQMLLIKKAVGARFPSLANSLNHSKLKKRITMMYKEKSGAGQKMRALALVPTLALALCVAAVPAVRAAVSTISSSELSVNKSNEKVAHDKTSAKVFRVTNINNVAGKTTVTIKGENLGDHITVSGGTFTTMGQTYQATSLQCDMTDGVAIIKAVFPFISEFDDTGMTLMVNGEEMSLDLEKFFNNAKSVTVKEINPASTNSTDNAGVSYSTSSSVPADMEVYVDGEKIDASALNSISPGSIASMSVDKNGKQITITLKK